MKKLLLFLCLFTFSISAQFNGFDGRFSHFSNFVPEQEQVAEYVYQSESLALFARMEVQPSEERKQLIDGLIANFKNESLWELGAFWNGMDAIWCFAAHDQSAAPLNWVEDDHNCSEVNSPPFVADSGYSGNAAGTAYLRTGYNPAVDGNGFTANNAAFGIVVVKLVDKSFAYHMGAVDYSIDDYNILIPGKANSSNETCALNSAYPGSGNAFVNDKNMITVSRTGAGNFSVYENGSLLETINSATSGVPNFEIYIIGFQDDGVNYSSAISESIIAFAFIGRGLTSGEASTLFTLIEAYLDAIGAGVMP